MSDVRRADPGPNPRPIDPEVWRLQLEKLRRIAHAMRDAAEAIRRNFPVTGHPRPPHLRLLKTPAQGEKIVFEVINALVVLEKELYPRKGNDIHATPWQELFRQANEPFPLTIKKSDLTEERVFTGERHKPYFKSHNHAREYYRGGEVAAADVLGGGPVRTPVLNVLEKAMLAFEEILRRYDLIERVAEMSAAHPPGWDWPKVPTIPNHLPEVLERSAEDLERLIEQGGRGVQASDLVGQKAPSGGEKSH
jgi:hypothetical protein